MQLTHLLAAGLSTALVSAKATNSRRTVACDFGTTADSGATCESFASSWGMSVNDLKDLNPGITCPNLDINDSYCVIGTVTKDPAATTFKTSTTKQASPTTKQASPTTTKAPSTTTETSGNTPQMPGLAEDCDGFHKIASGDQCDNVANRYGISVDQFRSWNSEVNDKCSNLWLDYYVCVHVSPKPQMPGIVDTCTSYHQVGDQDSCWSIYTDAELSFDEFRSLNKEVDSNCSNLWLGYYVCVGA